MLEGVVGDCVGVDVEVVICFIYGKFYMVDV